MGLLPCMCGDRPGWYSCRTRPAARLRQRPAPVRAPPPAASANTTKKSFGLELQERRQAGAAAAGAAGTAGAAGAAASQLKSRKFPWLGMPKDADWIL